MSLSPPSIVERISELPKAERDALILSLSAEKALALRYDWPSWARTNQLLPPGSWSYWMLKAGRGFGKTRTGSETLRQRIKDGVKQANIIVRTVGDIEKVLVRSSGGILKVCPPDERPTWVANKRLFLWPGGATSFVFTAEEPDSLRGPECEFLWCFIAGTMIETPDGRRPVEEIRAGDLVSTRFGPRRVIATGNRQAAVGTVAFSDGSELTGTAEHPLLTLYGWTRLDSLSNGQLIGKATPWPTSAKRSVTGNGVPCTSIDWSGNKRAGRSRGAMKSTTSTRIARTTTSVISNVLLTVSTGPGTLQNIAVAALRAREGTPQPVRSADYPWYSRHNAKSRRNASAVIVNSQIKNAKVLGFVHFVGQPSSRVGVNFAASVVSTWAPAGKQTVYNLTVEAEHEYIANGCIVHNCDELAAWRYSEDTWNNAMMGLRLGANPQAIITTTPRPTKLVRELIANPFTVLTAGTTYENRANLAAAFYTQIIRKYEGTRLGRQELLAEVLDDNPGALFKQTDIDGARVTKLPPLARIVVAMDPAVTSSEESDEWGIIASGQDGRDPAHFYLLADESGIYTPDEAAKQAVRLYHRLAADRLVGEANNGGDMIEALVRHQDANVAYKKVTASRGKQVRAEPVSALYEQGRVHHHGIFAQLEDQATSWNPKTDKDSPDRMDAMVWAITELAEGSSGWAGFVKEEGEKAAAGQGQPTPRVNVEGGNRDKCECGSVIWKDEKCWKCGRPRPQI